jgi:segregation and condensation protein A
MAVTDTAELEMESIGPAVELPSFSGPLDLLLHLIRKNELSIYDIPIALICEQYHEHLEAMHELDLELAGEYMWMASWLLHLKSRMLLPTHSDEKTDPREELVERLLEYRRVKEMAALLYERDVVRRCIWTAKIDSEIQPEQDEIDLDALDLRVLAQAYLDVMQRFRVSHPPPLHVEPLRFRLKEKMREIYDRVTGGRSMPLLKHLHRRQDAEELVVLFVAALELIRMGVVRASQRKAFAEIYLRKTEKPLDDELLSAYGERSDE